MIFIVFLLRKWWGFVYFFFVSRTRSLARRGGVVEYCVYVRLRLVTSQGPPYPSRSPRAHPSLVLVCFYTLDKSSTLRKTPRLAAPLWRLWLRGPPQQ